MTNVPITRSGSPGGCSRADSMTGDAGLILPDQSATNDLVDQTWIGTSSRPVATAPGSAW